jgi:hypothetical protein
MLGHAMQNLYGSARFLCRPKTGNHSAVVMGVKLNFLHLIIFYPLIGLRAKRLAYFAQIATKLFCRLLRKQVNSGHFFNAGLHLPWAVKEI